MCRYLTADGLCAASEGLVAPFPPCEFIRRGREFRDCDTYRQYMTELYLNSEYVYDAETDTFPMFVSRDLNEWERDYFVEPPF